MRGHQSGYRKLSKGSGARVALLRGLTRDLLIRERITTTVARAKETKRVAERLITLGIDAHKATTPEQKLHLRRQAVADLPDEAVIKHLFDEVAPRMAARNGGYTRMVLLGTRRGDAAEVAILELVDQAEPKLKAPRARKSETETATA